MVARLGIVTRQLLFIIECWCESRMEEFGVDLDDEHIGRAWFWKSLSCLMLLRLANCSATAATNCDLDEGDICEDGVGAEESKLVEHMDADELLLLVLAVEGEIVECELAALPRCRCRW